MTDCIEIETNPWQSEIEIGEDIDLEVSVEADFSVEVEAELSDESETHLLLGDIVDEFEADGTEYDFCMEFSNAERAYVYVGPELPAVDVEWSTDAWFRDDGWFDDEGW